MTPELVRFGEGATPRVVVAGASAINGLAFTPWQLWAFLRAELAAFSESPFRCANGERATMASIRTLHPQSVGVERMVPVALRLLDELMPMLVTAPPDLRVALVLCLPARMAPGGGRTYPQQRRILERELSAHVAAVQAARGGPAPVVRVLPLGHAAMAFALREVAAAMASGAIEVAFVGGLETAYDPARIEDLIAAGRLFDNENLDAAIQGEGGAFALLAPHDVARMCRWPALAELKVAATAVEPATIDNDLPLTASALSRCAVAATDGLDHRGASLDWWITDMTAEPFRVQEFQLAWPRAAARRMREDATVDFIASQLGDLGAAAMPTSIALATEGFARGAPKARTCVITGSSISGERGVVLLERCG
ncbi:MAG: hypothetical protein U0326_07535 [Polyangiales bacterium]